LASPNPAVEIPQRRFHNVMVLWSIVERLGQISPPYFCFGRIAPRYFLQGRRSRIHEADSERVAISVRGAWNFPYTKPIVVGLASTVKSRDPAIDQVRLCDHGDHRRAEMG